MLRSLICTFVGHVDHGKTSILDRVRGTSIAKGEAGLITQCISCTNIKFDLIKKLCGDLLKQQIKIPGFLFVDTPGHASFNNLRKRGGSLADIAVLVIDINEGLKPQTLEAIEILKNYKTPFIIAANKIDLVSGYRSEKKFLIENINSLPERAQQELDKKLYELVGKLAELNLNSERFDRVDDYTKQIAIVPTSAKKGDGIPELLLVLAGLAQKYLETKLKVNLKDQAKGTVLEVKEEQGIGITLDTIIYDGSIEKGDTIIIGTLAEPIETKVKSLFEPGIKKKFEPVDKAEAAIGIKISALNIEDVISGMPLRVANKNKEKIIKEIKAEVDEVIIETDGEGIVVKADTLGSLEALVNLLKEKNILIKKATIGDISKKDISEASAEENSLNKVIVAFNVKQLEKTKNVKIINHDVIYKITDDYEAWLDKEKKKIESKVLEGIPKPCKIQLLSGYVFRQSNPAVIGVEVLGGTLKIGTPLMKNGRLVTEVKEIQLDGETIKEAAKGKQVAVAFPKVTFGRQICDGDILYSSINEDEFRKLKNLKKYLSEDEKEVLKEIAKIKRQENQMWGV